MGTELPFSFWYKLESVVHILNNFSMKEVFGTLQSLPHPVQQFA